jgi:DNA-binding response OmpR family regulator
MDEPPYRVLIVDDDPMQLSLVGRALRGDAFSVEVSGSALGVTNLVRTFAPHLVLLDVRIPELSGDRLLTLLRRQALPGTLLILYSACDLEQLRELAMKVGADGWLSKSVELTALGGKLRTLIEKEARRPAR